MMIDSGATGNYVDPKSLRRLGIRRILKDFPEPLAGLNGEPLGGLITAESGTVLLAVVGHLESINLDVTPLGGYDVVLGVPRLRSHNPKVNWRKGTLEDFDCKCAMKPWRQQKNGNWNWKPSVKSNCGTSDRSRGKARNAHLSPKPCREKVMGRFGGEPAKDVPTDVSDDETTESKTVAPKSGRKRAGKARPTEKKEVSVPADKRNDQKKAPSDGKIASDDEVETGKVKERLTKHEEIKITEEKSRTLPIREKKKPFSQNKNSRAGEERNMTAQNKKKRTAKGNKTKNKNKGKNTYWSDYDDSDKENIDPKILAATEAKLPAEYTDFKELFEQPQTYQLPQYGRHDHKIPLQEGKDPACRKIYAMSTKESKVLKEYIAENLEKGIIRPSTSLTGFGVLFVPKKNGELRLCIDYRSLNNITIKDRHPFPLISEIQDRIRGAKIFTKIYIRDAYHQIRIAKGEEWKTAFRTKYGHYEYMVLPFGLTNAPATFQRFINEVLGEILDEYVIAYLDDILVFSETGKEHVHHVRKVLGKLQKAELRIKLEKCEFNVHETDFLGHWISPEGIHVEQNKIQAINEWPPPTNLKELQQFTGLVNYYRRFVNGYGTIMAPLFSLLRKNVPYEWNEPQQKAFEHVKTKLTNAPILVQHNPAKQTTIETDASDYAIGMRMTQPDENGKPKPVAFHSRKMVPAELNYDIHDKEMLAIVTAFKVWRVYLEGAQQTIIIKTDHKNLTFFTTTKELTRRQARWAEVLSQYDFKIVHCRGTENAQADALSRRPDYEVRGNEASPAILTKGGDGALRYKRPTLAATLALQPESLIENAFDKRQLMIQYLALPTGKQIDLKRWKMDQFTIMV